MGNKLGPLVSGLRGITCEYLSQSDGAPIQLSLVKIHGEGISQVKTDLSSTGKKTTAYGQEPEVSGYFTTNGDNGTIDVLVGNYWLSASSIAFSAPEDAAKFLTPVISKLG